MFLKFLISLLKWYLPTAVSFIAASHTLTKRVLHLIRVLRLSFFKIAFTFLFSYVRHFSRTPVWLVYKSITPVNIQLSRRKFNNYSTTVCRYTDSFHWWKCAPKKSIFTSLQSTTLPRIILCSFYSPFAIKYPVSTLGIEKAFGPMKTLPAIQKMLVSPADFSTRLVAVILFGILGSYLSLNIWEIFNKNWENKC